MRQYAGASGPTPKVPVTKAQYDALKPGEMFIDQDGKVKPKH
jgi:hypothetical protein